MIQVKIYPNSPKVATESLFLDLYKTEPIKLTISVEDITNAEATSVFSRTFKVPATRHNEEFFKQAFLVSGVTYDVTLKKPAEILVDGAEFKQGHIRLQKIYVNGDLDKTDYELLFLGETRDFSSILADKPMCQLVMTDFNWDNLPVAYTNSGAFTGPFTSLDLQQSWQAFPESTSLTAGWANGDMIFPLIDHGNTYDDNGHPNESVISLTNAGGGSGGGGGNNKRFINPQWPVTADRFKPMIRAKRTWDQIFEDAGYTYESTFLDSDRFKQMYVSAFGNNESIQMEISQNTTTNFSAVENTSTQDISYNTADYLQLNDAVYNPGGNFTPGTSESYFTAPGAATLSGNYYILQGAAFMWAQIENSNFGFTAVSSGLNMYAVSGPGITSPVLLASGNTTINGISSFYYDSRNGGFQIGAGTVLKIVAEAASVFDVGGVTDISWGCTAAPGNYYAPQDLDCEYKQIDYIKDVLTMFRLVMQPSANRPNHFTIEPWQEFIGSGTTYDWSHKLQKEKDFVIEPLFNTQSQSVDFSFVEDEDYINTYHQDNTKHPYGWLQFNSANELLKGNRSIEVTGISPTPLDQIEQRSGTGTADAGFIIPIIHGHESGTSATEHVAIKPNTRFLFYNGLINLPVTSSHWNLSVAGVATSQSNYPLVSSYESWPPSPTGLNLNFFNDTRYYLSPSPGLGFFDQSPTLFDEYWSRYISSLYNKYSRRVTAYFTLDNTDLQDLTFDDLIFLNGTYYRPEKINNAEVGATSSVQVNLITVLDAQPIWQDEPLAVTSVIEGAPTCADGEGSVTIVTGGTPTFTILLDNGYAAQYTDTVGLGSYTMTFNGIPTGVHQMTLTDSLGRVWSQSITIPASTASSPTTTISGILQPTICVGNCDGEGTVNVSGGTAPYTIYWIDGVVQTGNGPFTRTDFCSDDYFFYIEDANSCVSPTSEISFTCNEGSNFYIARQQLNSCSALSTQTWIVESNTVYSNNTNVSLLGVQGCYIIMQPTTSTTPDYLVDTDFPSCTACENVPVIISWLVQELGQACSSVGSQFYVETTGWNISAGDVVKLNNSSTVCYEAISSSTTVQGQAQVQELYADCPSCQGSSGFVYSASYCDGGSIVIVESTIELSPGHTWKTVNGDCVSINGISTSSPTEQIDTTEQFKSCTSCAGQPVTTTTEHQYVGPASYSYTDEYGSTQFISVVTNQKPLIRCTLVGSVVQFSGTGTWANLYTLCGQQFPTAKLLDCQSGYYVSVVSAYGHSIGDVVQYQNGAGGGGAIYCGTITDITSLIPTAKLVGPQSYDCNDNVHCAP